MYFIFDCNGAIVGNSRGYRTLKGANTQAASKKVRQAVYKAYDARANKDDNLLHRIRLISPNVI